MSTQTANNATLTVSSATTSTVVATGAGSWVGFHFAISSSTAGAEGQMRYAYTSAGTDRLRVAPAFDVVPTNGDDMLVAKNQDDYDSDYGNKWKLVLKAAAEWDAGDLFEVGDGTDNMVFGMTGQGVSLDEYFEVFAGSYMGLGYLFGESSLGGWYFNSNNSISTLGYQYIIVHSSATFFATNTNMGTVFAHSVIFEEGSEEYFYDVSFANLMYNGFRLKGNVYGENLKLQGTGVANDYCIVASTIASFDGPLILSNSYGFEASASNQTIRINKYISVNNLQDVEAHNTTQWEFLDPEWTNPEILWTQTAGESTVSEIFSFVGTMSETDGTAIASVLGVITEGSAAVRNNYLQVVTDASGMFETTLVKRYWASSTASTTYGPFTGRGWKYGYDPFEGVFTFNAPTTLPASMAIDTEITTSTYASAAALAAEISDETITNDGVWYVQVSVTASAELSAVVSTAGSYQGTIRELYTAGDGKTQEWFLVNTSSTSGVPPTTAVTWSEAGTSRGVQVAASDHVFTYHIDAKEAALALAYDKQQALFANTSTTAAYISTARLRHVHLMDKTGDTFLTESYFSTGVFVSNRGTGTIDYMTADDGWTFTPPEQFTFTLTGLKADSEVRIYNAADDSELAGIESSGTTFNYNYTYSGSDITAYVVVFNLNWKEVRLSGDSAVTLSNSNQSIPIQQQVDRVYANP